MTAYRYLLTGAKGFIGSYFKRYLEEARYTVKTFDTDIRSYQEFKGVLDILNKDLNVDTVVNFAAVHTTNNYTEMAQVNAIGALNVARACYEYKDNVRLIHISTGNVYGYGGPDYEMCREEWYLPMLNMKEQIDDFYGLSKATGELYVKYYRDVGLTVDILRLFGVFGIGGRGVVNHFVNQALNGEPLTVNGFGHKTVHLTYVDELGPLLTDIANNPPKGQHKRGVTMNVAGSSRHGDSHYITVLELARIICKLFDYEPTIQFTSNYSDKPTIRRANTEMMEQLYPLKLRRGLEENLKSFIKQEKEKRERN